MNTGDPAPPAARDEDDGLPGDGAPGASAAPSPADPSPADPSPAARWRARLARPFWNAHESRLRALWRVLALTGVALALSRVAVLALRAAGVPRQGPESPLRALVALLIVLASVGLVARLLERRSLREFGLAIDGAWLADLGFGLALGALLMTLIFAVELSAGWITATYVLDVGATPVALGETLGSLLLLFVTVAINEELVFRGYLLRTLAEGLGGRALPPRPALALSLALTSGVFGLAHLGNPNSTWVSTLSITAAGVLLALGYVLTGRLGIPIGLHLTWNYFQGPVYGFAVSGVRSSHSTLMVLDQRGPALWTGGDFGPEAGLIGVFAVGLGMLLVLAWVRWREGRVLLCAALAEPPAARTRAA